MMGEVKRVDERELVGKLSREKRGGGLQGRGSGLGMKVLGGKGDRRGRWEGNGGFRGEGEPGISLGKVPGSSTQLPEELALWLVFVEFVVGTFALYSLLCRHAKVSLIPNNQLEERELSNHKLETPSNGLKRSQTIKKKLENSKIAQYVLFLVTIMGTSMVIGDGVLTPCISDVVVGVSVAILIILFTFQQFGTDIVGFTFAPILILWFGIYNLITHDISVLRAVNPTYIFRYFHRNGKQAWISLGGVVLCTTETLYWPMFVMAIAAAIVGSQSMISATFSIISQSLSLGCFPRVKVVHTSAKYEGQVYMPEVHYMLMVACITVTAIFKTGDQIGNAYGIAVVTVMVITTCLLTLIMLVVWQTSIWLIAIFFMVSIGGYLPLCFAAVLMVVMGIWHYVHKQRYMFELKNKVSSEHMKQLASDPNINRLVQGIPPIFSHYVSNIPSIHWVVVIVSVKPIPISKNSELKDFEQQLVENLKEFIQNEHFILGGGTTEKSEEAVTNGQSLNAEKEIQQVNPPRVSSGSIQSLSAASSTSPSRRIVSAPSRGAEEEMQFVQEAMDKDLAPVTWASKPVAGKAKARSTHSTCEAWLIVMEVLPTSKLNYLA
ncbi:potassium transporter 5-like [Pyrus ussuriensis x Pyrus communis]|uniref:Potassium transporter 5-like n=1 Tax=Pyrus ussuriensis x Pyrus communis TaxID=2448454 RepID=A0A5N5F7X2_9ROSA|nr:potassium transporter 5-like [Pyrus ussuriensis x Pyrus communis]